MAKFKIVTGPAGVGKSTHLRKFTQELRDQNKSFVVCAPTGLAALNVGGVTIHSLFGIRSDWKQRLCKESEQYLRDIEVIVIDEFSMISLEMFEVMSRVLKKIMKSDEVFGGKQVTMYGDILQLSPISESKKYFFESSEFSISNCDVTYLKDVKRQLDLDFIESLNSIRSGKVRNVDIDLFGSLGYVQSDALSLYPRKVDVEAKNMERLRQIDSEETIYFSQDHKGSEMSLKSLFKTTLTPMCLRIKEGARIMCTINDPDGRFVNGSQGTLICLKHDVLTVKLDTGKKVEVRRVTFTNNNRFYPCSFKQFPLVLAYALTIHKAQGLTVDKLNVDFRGYFGSPSMVYVALSRVKDFNKLSVLGFDKNIIACDQRALDFEKELLCRSSLVDVA